MAIHLCDECARLGLHRQELEEKVRLLSLDVARILRSRRQAEVKLERLKRDVEADAHDRDFSS